MMGDLDEAYQSFDKALEIIPDHLGALMGKASALLQEGKNEEALEWYDAALKIDPSNDEAFKCRETIRKIFGASPDDAQDDAEAFDGPADAPENGDLDA